MTKRCDPIDLHVGQRLRQRRLMLGMTQEQLAKSIGVSFQMVQKYEKGNSRIGASRLMKIARALGVAEAFFFDGATSNVTASPRVAESGARMEEILTQKETIDLLKAYYELPEQVRRHVLGMVKSLKDKSDTEAA